MFKNMAEILTDGRVGDFSIEHFDITKNDIRAYYLDKIPAGTYVKLTHNGNCIMSNTPFECETNSEIVKKAHGDVLIGGLGIGMILLPIQEKDTVNSITVVELRQEVIDLVAPQLPLNEKVRIIHGGVFEYVPEQKYHTIYLDIWNEMSRDIAIRQAIPLLERYQEFLVPEQEDPKRYLSFWMEKEVNAQME